MQTLKFGDEDGARRYEARLEEKRKAVGPAEAPLEQRANRSLKYFVGGSKRQRRTTLYENMHRDLSAEKDRAREAHE